MHKSFCVNFSSGYTGRSYDRKPANHSGPPPAHPFPISTMSKSNRGLPQTKISNHSRDFDPRRRAPLSGPLRDGRRLIRPTPTNRQTLICKKMTLFSKLAENQRKLGKFICGASGQRHGRSLQPPFDSIQRLTKPAKTDPAPPGKNDSNEMRASGFPLTPAY